MFPTLNLFLLMSLILTGGIFGFFFAWICSTMWGLDNADPRTAIAAMQAMNASVRNMVFAPFFFGTAPILALTGAIAFSNQQKLPRHALHVASRNTIPMPFTASIAVQW